VYIVKKQILDAGVLLAETHGYQGVFKRHIAAYLKCGMGTINYHWGTVVELRSAMVREAKRKGRHERIMRAATNSVLNA
jgi:AcrR family transcriptional regulator